MAYKVGMVSLGCPKNQVDAEMMLKTLADSGFIITPVEAEADAIIVNTCGFIEDAKTEAIENILEVSLHKETGVLKALIVTGCMAERYKDHITSEIPEVDVVVGIGSNDKIADIVTDAIEGRKKNAYGDKLDFNMDSERMLSTVSYSAYLKLADGCDNRCTYCAIPLIRGPFRSRKKESIIKEAKTLSDSGVKEIILIAQDTTRYGEDLYGKLMLPELLRELCGIDGIRWIRMLYTYPDRITDELLDTIAENDKVLPYLDIPLQHCNEDVLRRMNRGGSRDSLSKLIEDIRTKLPGVTIRTTFITGFPGETDGQFTELNEFVKAMRFDRLGCFAYSAEEDTPAADFDGQVEEQVKHDRMELIMNDQLTIVNEKMQDKIGSEAEVLIEGYDDYIRCYFGRTAADAPEVDGKIFFISDRQLKVGEFVNVLINDTLEYDLLGELID